ncbi:MAG: uncharacterized protein KVP18_003460 [Porospora cf. gigantea A]|uniref:uncharacterized protein n=1 Tax=Porospora cf. gigantea A TaxID=2853593 RepID=UPI003559B660|nr:MAG: hypothetical protein KVP18_003460 [Porospora cf. gigantea A]
MNDDFDIDSVSEMAAALMCISTLLSFLVLLIVNGDLLIHFDGCRLNCRFSQQYKEQTATNIAAGVEEHIRSKLRGEHPPHFLPTPLSRSTLLSEVLGDVSWSQPWSQRSETQESQESQRRAAWADSTWSCSQSQERVLDDIPPLDCVRLNSREVDFDATEAGAEMYTFSSRDLGVSGTLQTVSTSFEVGGECLTIVMVER